METVSIIILKRILDNQLGWAFTSKDFLDIGSRSSIDQALARLVNKSKILRLDRGLFYYPKNHPVLGALTPSPDKIAQAIAAKSGDKAYPSGATAANMLGLSTQIPAKPSYLTSGKSRTLTFSGQTITLKHARVPIIDKLPMSLNITLQALSYLGKDGIDNQTIAKCVRHLNDQDIKRLSLVTDQIPGWMTDIIQKIKQEKKD